MSTYQRNTTHFATIIPEKVVPGGESENAP